MEVTLWNELNDQASEKISGGLANPTNNGNGGENGSGNSVDAIFKSTPASETSPNSPKYGIDGGVANSDHFFQFIGVIGKSKV